MALIGGLVLNMNQEIMINVSNTDEGKQKLQSFLRKGWNVYFSFPLIEADNEVRLAKVVLTRKHIKRKIEYGWIRILCKPQNG